MKTNVLFFTRAEEEAPAKDATKAVWIYDMRSGAPAYGRPDLVFVPQSGGGPDPRLVELVRLLARSVAQDWYEQLAEEHRPKRPELAGDCHMKVALYARYSTDNQRDVSITDQFRVCRAYAEKQGWQIVEQYSDHAISGASLLRAGIQALIADALRGYIGRIIWNRQRFIKDPETGKRQARPNPSAEWIIQEVPELRIIDDELWNAAKARQERIKTGRGEDGHEVQNSFRDRRRPKYIFSGLIKCACCGGGYAMISADLTGCSTARNKGTCANRKSIPRARLEERVLNAWRHHLMDPALKEFCDEFTREMNRLRIECSASLDGMRSEVKRIEHELDTLLNLILKGGAADRINAKMVQLEVRKAELERLLADAEEPPPLLHSEMATFYREKVAALHEALQDDSEATRLKAGEILRSLVKEIVLTLQNDELKIDVRGDLAGILAISLKTKTPATRTGVSQVEMVAGTRNQRHPTFPALLVTVRSA